MKQMHNIYVVVNTDEERDEFIRLIGDSWDVYVPEISTLPYGLSASDTCDYCSLPTHMETITLTEFKKEQGIMKYKEGDMLVDKYGNEVKILGVCGSVYFRSDHGQFLKCSGSGFTEEQLNKYTLKTDKPAKTDMTVSELEVAAGLPAGTLNVVAESLDRS